MQFLGGRVNLVGDCQRRLAPRIQVYVTRHIDFTTGEWTQCSSLLLWISSTCSSTTNWLAACSSSTGPGTYRATGRWRLGLVHGPHMAAGRWTPIAERVRTYSERGGLTFRGHT